MRLDGKYVVEIRNGDGSLDRTVEASNLIVTGGMSRIVDWLVSNIYSTNYYPHVKQIDTTGMTVTSAGFTNAANAVDGNDSTFAYATIDSASWDGDWWKIDLGVSKDLFAVYVDWEEDDVNYGADYKFQYSSDNSTWYDFTVRLRPPQESLVRGKVLFNVSVSPPFSTQAVRYFRLNTKRGNDNETFNLYELKFYEVNALPQPPLVMALGTSVTPAFESDTALGSSSLVKKVSTTVKVSNTVARFIISLDGAEGNGTTFTEAGMFFYNTNNYTLQTTSNATTLFSRALFDTGWSKTFGQTADVYYELTISNAPVSSSSSSSSSSSV